MNKVHAGILKPNSFSGFSPNVIVFFHKAKNSIIAIATFLFFNDEKGKKNKMKNRKAIRLEYSLLMFLIALTFVSCEKTLPSAPEENELLDGPMEGLTSSEKLEFFRGD
ncbi:MAG: hypothetical protein ACJAZ2_002445, partial [Glaciecola sp.]